MGLYIGSTRYCQVIGKASNLPYDAEIEYLESTGTQWINTGITVNGANNIIAELKVIQTVDTNDVSFYFTQPTSGSGHFAAYANASNKYACVYRTKWAASSTSTDRNTHILNYDNGKLYVDGTLLVTASTTTSVTASGTLMLFGNHGINLNSFKLYYFKLMNNHVTVLDMIPVRVGQEGCLYDRVSGTLFRNAGTGNFTLGSDIT